jgi:NADH dehydrogenase
VNARTVQALPLVTVVEADVHNASALASLLHGHEAVINLVAILQGNEAAFERAHVALPKRLAAACKAAGTPHLLHVSALGVSDSAPSMYLRSKHRGEQALMAAGLPRLTILRPSVIFGAGDRFTNLFAKLQGIFPLMPLAGADARLQPVWVGDVANFLVKSITFHSEINISRYTNSSGQFGTQIVEAAGPDVFTLRQIVMFSSEQAGCPRPIVALPAGLAKLQALAMELMPGEPLMSRDNLASLAVPNVASAQLPGLQDFGIALSSLRAVGPSYLGLRGPRSVLDRYRKGA